jgi:hypothetical protein
MTDRACIGHAVHPVLVSAMDLLANMYEAADRIDRTRHIGHKLKSATPMLLPHIGSSVSKWTTIRR